MAILKHRGKFDLAILLFLSGLSLAPILGFNLPWTGGSIFIVFGVLLAWHCLVALKTKIIFGKPQGGGYVAMEDNKSVFWWIFIYYSTSSIGFFWVLIKHDAYNLFDQLKLF
ncbi:hypothetical protein N8708_03600 [Porticoccaceae bacterium]|jgi:hypothetical protein|nr:hypothetical protein [Porticoccaceae bacterium]MDA7589071.1 hypothetical protein [Porticoccaceae bacterium]MDC0370258.1 hypothetical protein [Porticoccaceae bacterium]